MAYVVFSVNPHDLGYADRITEKIVNAASVNILANLQSVSKDYEDTDTRMNDPRRSSHPSIVSSEWRVKFRMNKFIITNDAAENSSQVETLKFGNGTSRIFSNRIIRQASKGWSANDRHRKKSRGGKKPDVGDLGDPYLGMLKFWSKRDGMFLYRQSVRPIGADVVKDFNRAIDSAVSNGLESAYYETFESIYEDVEMINEIEGASPNETLEEMGYEDTSKQAVESADYNYGMIKTIEDSQLRNVQIDKQEFLTRVDDVHKSGQPKTHRPEIVEPIPEYDNPLTIIKNRILNWFGLGKK